MIELALALAASLAQAQTPPPAPQAGPPPITADMPASEIFPKRCAFCHGEDAKGQTKKGKELGAPDFTSAKWSKETTDKEVHDAITEGIVDKGKKKMPAFKDKLTPEQIAALEKYVRTFSQAPAK